ncbi:hypothetical protein [Serratia fonticola]|uniref:hypothetical protein n=1 Tax=Serratia fonticola TaxID=47917 RepID=UPI003AB0AD35
METIFIVGMFKSLNKRLAAECNRRDIRNYQVLADFGKQGFLGLVPTPHDAILAFQEWLKAENEEYHKLHIIVLPYCSITKEMDEELETVEEFGASVEYVEAGCDGWPSLLPRKKRPDTEFLNNVFKKTIELLPPIVEPEISVSDYYYQVAQANPKVMFSPHVFEHCDYVAPHRKLFMKSAVDALSEFLKQPPGLRVDAFFQEKGIEHAQSGGIITHLEVVSGNSKVKHSSQTHLKKGDNTTSAAAVRIYYHFINQNEINYIVITYAGAHPENDFSWVVNLPPD